MSNRSALKASVAAAVSMKSFMRCFLRPQVRGGDPLKAWLSDESREYPMKRRNQGTSRISLEHSTLASYRIDVAGFADQLH